jgi:hypothetical protein
MKLSVFFLKNSLLFYLAEKWFIVMFRKPVVYHFSLQKNAYKNSKAKSLTILSMNVLFDCQDIEKRKYDVSEYKTCIFSVYAPKLQQNRTTFSPPFLYL